jgi:hypothetical protein
MGDENERKHPEADIRQDPGIPGPKTPEELPPQDEPDVEEVPDTGPPESDEEGHMAPVGRRRRQLTVAPTPWDP